MGYIEQICKWMKCEKDEIGEVCLNIDTETQRYALSFIEFETRDFIGINYTDVDFTERFVILNKKYIISMGIVYRDDIVIEEPNSNHDIQYN